MLAVWPQSLARLEAELPAEEFQTWLKPLQAQCGAGASALVLYAPNAFVAELVAKRFLPRIVELLRQLSGKADAQVELAVGSLPREAPGKPSKPRAATAARLDEAKPQEDFVGNLDSSYTFDNFVEGKSNQLGRAAAWQVAQNPGYRAHNPLLLYGGTGLGKTHLMYAVGNEMRRLNPAARVLYLASGEFANAFFRALQGKTTDQFKRQFQNIDALLIDDIQFFAGKDRTQEEFFHTFNTLFDGKQQIVMTCDRDPREVEGLEPRLKSRLGWGLSMAIEPPDFETRAAILLSKAKVRRVELPEDVAFLIAKRIPSNVRDLEGAINTLIARANFTRQVITAEFAQETLRDLLRAHQQVVSIANIQKAVADYYQLRLSDLNSKSRTRTLARPRQMAMAIVKELTSHSLPEIGDAFGGRDHTTVLHACRQIRKLLDTDGQLREDWDKLLRKLSE